MKSIEVQLNEALEANKVQAAEIVSLKEAVTNSKKAIAKAERDSQLKESKLPVPCVTRLSEAFVNSTDNAGLKEAINVEAEYVKSLTKITKHNGAEDNSAVVNESAEMVESCKKEQYAAAIATGMSEAEAVGFSGYSPKK